MKKFLSAWRLVVLVLLLGANLWVWFEVARLSRAEVVVSFLDVGQGDAILIEAPGGHEVLIDGGPGRKVLSELGQVLPFYDRNLDLVIATHPDADHIGGLPLVLENYRVAGFLAPEVACRTALCSELEKEVTNLGLRKLVAARGEEILLGGGATLEILSPDGPVLGSDTNLASVVARLSFGQTTFLFTGDAPQVVERRLIAKDGTKLDVDVLKVGHHGSDTSSVPDFLALTSPQLAVISVGAKNRYGHPKASVLEELKKAGAEIWRTDEQGRLKIISDGEKITWP